MPAIGIFIDVKDLDAIAAIRRRLNNLGPTFDNIAQSMLLQAEDNFASEGAASGHPWKGLAASTLARRRKKGRGAKILQNTGIMAGSLVPLSGGFFAEISDAVSYAVFHVSDAPRSIIPLRNFLDMPEDAIAGWGDEILGALTGDG